jgi:hypothetical protein
MVSSAGIFENCRRRIDDLRRMKFIAAAWITAFGRPFGTGKPVKIACLAPLVALR